MVVNCKANNTVKFIPRNAEQYGKWRTCLKTRWRGISVNNFLVCENHFAKSQVGRGLSHEPKNDVRLLKDAVPNSDERDAPDSDSPREGQVKGLY